MPLSLTLASLWGLTACLLGLCPSRFHWPAASVLIATGIPLLGFVTMQMGPWWGLALMAAGVSVLRWPVFYAGRWLRRRVLQGGAHDS
jgi:membrane protein DedA with SNARE-associated domain